jgi:hypothetical protein
MAQVDFYLEVVDKIDIMSFVFAEGGYAIPAIHYKVPIYSEVRTIEDYLPLVDTSVLLFIVHDAYFKEPLAWETIDKEGGQYFYLRQRVGGPTIDFYSPGKIEKNGVQFIGQGSMSYYSSYQSPGSNKDIAAPEEQKLLFKKISRRIKNGLAIKNSKRTYWVGTKAMSNVVHGYKLMNVTDDLLDDFVDFIKANQR